MRRRKGQKKVDIASRSTSAKRDLDGEFLAGTESSVTKIEPTGEANFAKAWDREASDLSEQSLDSALDVGQDDSASRDLDQNRFGTMAGWAVLIVGLAGLIFFVVQRGRSEDGDLGARASANVERNVLVSPLEEREYTSPDGPVVAATFDRLSGQFVDPNGSGTIEPSADGEGIDGVFVAGSIFWAGRTHVAILSSEPLLASSDDCIVSSLVTTDLRAVDVASAGSCGAEFDPTGDRLACVGENLVMLEVWPFNPDSVTEPEVAAIIRTRLERRSGEAIESRRSTLELPTNDGASPVVASATTLHGAPGDEVTVEISNLSGTCELIDRSGVDVRLLPG